MLNTTSCCDDISLCHLETNNPYLWKEFNFYNLIVPPITTLRLLSILCVFNWNFAAMVWLPSLCLIVSADLSLAFVWHLQFCVQSTYCTKRFCLIFNIQIKE